MGVSCQSQDPRPSFPRSQVSGSHAPGPQVTSPRAPKPKGPGPRIPGPGPQSPASQAQILARAALATLKSGLIRKMRLISKFMVKKTIAIHKLTIVAFFLKSDTQTVLMKLFPDPNLQINILKFYPVLYGLIRKMRITSKFMAAQLG